MTSCQNWKLTWPPDGRGGAERPQRERHDEARRGRLQEVDGDVGDDEGGGDGRHGRLSGGAESATGLCPVGNLARRPSVGSTAGVAKPAACLVALPDLARSPALACPAAVLVRAVLAASLLAASSWRRAARRSRRRSANWTFRVVKADAGWYSGTPDAVQDVYLPGRATARARRSIHAWWWPDADPGRAGRLLPARRPLEPDRPPAAHGAAARSSASRCSRSTIAASARATATCPRSR